jgi:hypothetical protein
MDPAATATDRSTLASLDARINAAGLAPASIRCIRTRIEFRIAR